MEDFGLYLVMTNPVVGYERCCEAAVNAGVRIVQLRMKDAPRAEVVSVARALRRITAGSRTLLIVNDDPEAAAEADADGVHVGQTDMPVAEVRRRFPGLKIVGKSTHSPAQALAAVGESPDYIGAGPVWPTPTKKIPDPTLGVEAAAEKGIELITTDLLGKEPNDVLADFEWSEDGKRLLSCAGGFAPYKCTHNEKSGQVTAKIDSYHCEGCPFAGECPAKRKGITATIVASRKSTRRARHKRRIGSKEFNKYYRLRNGAETIPSILKRKYRLDRLPRGLLRGKLFFGAKVAALNFGKLLGFMRNTGNDAENPLLA